MYFLYTGDKRWDKDFELSSCAVLSFSQSKSYRIKGEAGAVKPV